MVGSAPLPRGEMVSKVWDHIKKHNLQNPENRREILADDKLEAVFGKKKNTDIFVDSEQLRRVLSVFVPALVYALAVQLVGLYVASAVYIARPSRRGRT